MNTSITIIWAGNVWKFLSKKLSGNYSVEQISAREIWGVSWTLVSRFSGEIARIFQDKETIESILVRMKKWERVIYTGKTGPLLDKLVHTIETEYPERMGYFYILWANGFKSYAEDRIPRLVLNHAIKEEQVNGEKNPTPFTLAGKSYFYHPNPSDFDEELVKNIGFDVELTSDKNVFLKALYLKCCINTIINSITLCQNSNISVAVWYFERYYPGFIDDTISELYLVIDNLAPGLLWKEEIQKEIYACKESVPYVVPSSVNQFWRIEQGEMFADYQNSDISVLLGWILQYAQKHHISTPMLLNLMSEIIGRWNRLNGIHLGNDNRTIFVLPTKEWQHPIFTNTGVQ